MAMALSNPAIAATPRIGRGCLSPPVVLSSNSAFCGQSRVSTGAFPGRHFRRAFSGIHASASGVAEQSMKEGIKESSQRVSEVSHLFSLFLYDYAK